MEEMQVRVVEARAQERVAEIAHGGRLGDGGEDIVGRAHEGDAPRRHRERELTRGPLHPGSS